MRQTFKIAAVCLMAMVMVMPNLVAFAAPTATMGNNPTKSIYRHFENYFMVGNIWSSSWRGPMNAPEREFLAYHFNAITAEDYHKPDQIVPAGAQFRDFNNVAGWNWERAERVLNFAEENNMAMIGHTLVWHGQSPLWFTGAPGHAQLPLLTRQQAMYNMERYINEVAGRWSGRIHSWDVVNEVFVNWFSHGDWTQNPDWRHWLRRGDTGLGTNDLRWYDAFANGARANECGSDYIFYAFKFTRLADPNAILYYNDFNEEHPGKREAIAQMVEQINARWRGHPQYDGRLLIEVIGMQSHFHLGAPGAGGGTDFALVRAAIERFIRTGARISVTELDITIGTSQNPLGTPLNQNHQQLQADAFRRVMEFYVQFHQHINRVSFWGMEDSRSWRRAQHPTLFAENFVPKAAFDAVLAVGHAPTAGRNAAGAPQRPAPQPAPPVATPTPDANDNEATPTPAQLLISPPTPAETPTPTPATPLSIIRFAIGSETYTINETANQLDAAPFIDETTDRTMLPLRAVATALGAEVAWEGSTRTVTITQAHTTLTLTADIPLPDNMGAPLIVNDRVFVPARYVAEMLGANVLWDAMNRAVYITV